MSEYYEKFTSFVNNKILLPLFGETEDGNYKVRLSLQSLNEDSRKPWIKESKLPIHGRGWIRFGGDYRNSFTLRLEWHLWGNSCRISYEQCDQEYGHTASVALPPVSFYLSLESPWKHWSRPKQRKQWALRVFDKAFWWDIGTDPHGWSSKDPKWRHGCIHPIDAIFGSTKLKTKELGKHDVSIPMPEGSYPAKVVMEDCAWKRPRLPWASHRGTYAKVDIDVGIPFEGKGENSWDCGEDGLYGLSREVRNVEEAIARTVQSVLESRRKYNGNRDAKYPPPEERIKAVTERRKKAEEERQQNPGKYAVCSA